MKLKQATFALFLVLSQHTLLQVAFAQSESDIEEIVVQGRYLSIDKLNSVKTPTPIIDVPQSLSIFTNEQIKDQAFQNFGDVLRYTPGLSISQGEGHRDAIIIRGIQTTADFFIDGVRDDVQYYRPLYNVEQLEILRGSNALLFGRGGGGGVINRVTKKASTEAQFSDVRVSVDSFGSATVAGDSNLIVSDDIAFRLNAYHQDLENHRDFFGGKSFAVNPTLTVMFSPDTKGMISYEYVDDERSIDRGVPSLNVDGGPNVPLSGFEETFFGSPDQNLTTLQAHILRAGVEHEFSDTLRANVSAQYADFDKLYQNLYASDAVDLFDGRLEQIELDGYLDTTLRENLLVQANLVGEFETGGIGHTILFGVELGSQKTANGRFDNVFTDNGDDQLLIPFSDPLNIPDFAFSAPARDRESDVTFRSVYLQDQLDLSDELKVVLGARLDEFDIQVNDIAAAEQFERKDSEVTPRLGAIYKPADNVSVYASYSETFLPRSGDQFLTLDLDTASTRPQFFANRELGVKWDLQPTLSLTTAVFELDRESYTSTDPQDPEQLIIVEGSKTTGFEVQLLGALTDVWSISTGYSYLDGKVQRANGGGDSGNRTRQTPENMFSIWNDFALNDQLSVALGATYQDSFFVQEDNSVEVPSYTRFDAAAYYQLSDTSRIQLNVENLFNEAYFPDAHSNSNISIGRPINARLTYAHSF